MKSILEFLKSTLIGGLFVVLPVAILLLLLRELVGMADALVDPLVQLLPVESLGGIDMARLVAWLSVILVCFLTGLAAKAGFSAMIGNWFERVVLMRIPGYSMIKGLTGSFAADQGESGFKPAVMLVADDTWELAFIVEELQNDNFTVFVPTAPTPNMGRIYFVGKDRIRKLDASMGSAMNCVMQWGIGSKELFGPAEKSGGAAELS